MTYLIISTDTRAQGWATDRAEALISERAPTAILPDCWTVYPVCRITLK